MISNKKFLITGSSGQLAKEFIRSFEKQGFNFSAPGEDQFDITDPAKVRAVIRQYDPDIILNCAAYNLVDNAEDEPQKALKVNSEAVSILAVACEETGIFPVHFSTDYIFDGTKKDFYTEEDRPNPLNVYGQSKLKGEEEIRKELKSFLIFRLSWVFGAGEQNFLYKLSQWAKGKESLKVVSDEVSVPTYTEDVVKVVMRALEQGLEGTYHLTNTGRCSRYEWAKYYFEKMEISTEIQECSITEFSAKAKRPLETVMSNKKISDTLNISIPTWQDAVNRMVYHKRKNENVTM